MTCASCGRQVATGARYCIHCGAEQSVPTPIAVVAASMTRRGGREAANAAHAEPAGSVAPKRVPDRPAYDDAGAPRRPTEGGNAANSDAPARPAYADAPPRRGIAVALLACLVVVAIGVGAYAYWRTEHAQGDVSASAPAPTAEPPASAAASTAPATSPAESPTQAPAEPSAQAAPASPEAASPATPASPTEAAQPASAEPSAGATNAPVEIKPLPPRSSGRPPRHAQPAGPAQEPATKAGPPAEAPAHAEESRAQAHVRAAASAAPPVADRWQRLDEALAQCTRTDFISRVICGQRARFRYCDGYWGKVPQCPGNASTNDHGQ